MDIMGIWINNKWFEIIEINKTLHNNIWIFDVAYELEGVSGNCKLKYVYGPNSRLLNRMSLIVVEHSLINYKKIRKTTFSNIEHLIAHAIRYDLKPYLKEIEEYEENLVKPVVDFLEHEYMENENKYVLYFKFNNSKIERKMEIHLDEFDNFALGRFICSPNQTSEEEFEAFSSWEDYVWEQAMENSPLKLLLQLMD